MTRRRPVRRRPGRVRRPARRAPHPFPGRCDDGRSPSPAPRRTHSSNGILRSLVLLGVSVVDDLGVDDVGIAVGAGSLTVGGLCRGVGVDRLAEGLRLLRQLLDRGLDRGGVGALQRFLRVGDGCLDLLLDLRRDLVLVLLEELLGLVDERLRLVAGLGLLAALAVLVGVGLRVLDHAVDLVLAQAGTVLDADGVLLAGALVLRGDVHDAVGVDVEGHLDLRDTLRCRGDAAELEAAQQLVVRGDLALTLIDLDLHRRLVVLGRGVGLRPLGRDRGVALDQLVHHAALGLDAEGERGDVEQQHVLDLTAEHTGLQCGADGDDLVRVDALVGLAATGQFLHQVGDGGHTGRTTDEHDMVDVADGDARILDDGLERRAGALQQIRGDLLELAARELLVEEQRVLVGVDGDVGQVDRGALRARELDLGLLGGLTQTLQGHLVLGQVDAVLALELLHEPVDDALIPVVTTEVVVTGGRADLDDAVADLEQRDVEGTATEVEDQDGLFLLALVEAVGQGGRGRLVDDAEHVEAGDLAGFLGGLTLGVVEVRGHRDDGVGDVLTQVRLGVALELHERARADLLRGVLLVVDLDGPVAFAHVALDGADGAVDVGDRLVLRGLTDQHLAVTRERDHRRCGPRAFGVGDDGGFAAFEHGDHRVGGTEVDSNSTRHVWLPPSLWVCTRVLVPRSRDRGDVVAKLCGTGLQCVRLMSY
ncbi:NAD-specific glutamate dehydrogenase [Gordonia terrae C-6]|uniref:NAD-specific glutamate dehydrogenase n=1 Tax=Gordonia terrae C-6 TaxID=1316928 RepID=R7Y9B6_9ACTN|nr:NAD-specific glutamate dehydrogenase [Gordonia terrae C-6]